jgi:predicted CXXCH cytochrome family protein
MSRGVMKGLAVAALVTVALMAGRQTQSVGASDAKYLGSKMCKACHTGTHPAAVNGWAASAHAGAMWKVGEATGSEKIVADFSSAPFPQAQVAYVLGTGRKYQSFLDADLKVLPGRWVVAQKSWEPQAAADAKKDCLGCHTTGYDPAAGKWTELAVGCEMCHGPGSAHAGGADKKATIVQPATLDPAHQAMVCGQCHSVGKSKDGQYTFAAGFRPGDDLDQYFTLAPLANLPKDRPWTQYNELRLGGGQHLASGTVCETCHDPHGGGAHMLREQGNALCLKCHAGKLTGPQHSEQALAATQCTTCHMPGGKHTFGKPGH